MNIEKAKELQILMRKLDYCVEILTALDSGYDDEWVLKNSHTGVKVDIRPKTHLLVKQHYINEQNDLKKEIEDFK